MHDRKILYLQYTNPAGYPPLEHSSQILANQGWQILFLGTGALGADALRFPTHPNIVVRQLPFCPAGWQQKIHYLYFCLWVIGWAIRWQPQWIYASDLLSCPIGQLLSYFPKLKIIYHEHDSPGDHSQGLGMRFCLWSRKKIGARAKLCISPNESRKKRFESETGGHRNSLWIWNCPSKKEVSAPRLSYDGHSLRIVYHGSIVPQRIPITVLEALALFSDVRLRIIGYETVGHQGYIQELQTSAKKLGLEHRIEILGPVPHAEVLRCSRDCDVGLSFIPRNSRDPNFLHMAGASNKPFDYLANGLAVLVSELPDWKKMYVEPGYGLACDPDDSKSIAEALRWFLDHPREMREMGERGRQRILAEWNYEQQFSHVLKRLNGEAI